VTRPLTAGVFCAVGDAREGAAVPRRDTTTAPAECHRGPPPGFAAALPSKEHKGFGGSDGYLCARRKRTLVLRIRLRCVRLRCVRLNFFEICKAHYACKKFNHIITYLRCASLLVLPCTSKPPLLPDPMFTVPEAVPPSDSRCSPYQPPSDIAALGSGLVGLAVMYSLFGLSIPCLSAPGTMFTPVCVCVMGCIPRCTHSFPSINKMICKLCVFAKRKIVIF
jgi:hypothetical protein